MRQDSGDDRKRHRPKAASIDLQVQRADGVGEAPEPRPSAGRSTPERARPAKGDSPRAASGARPASRRAPRDGELASREPRADQLATFEHAITNTSGRRPRTTTRSSDDVTSSTNRRLDAEVRVRRIHSGVPTVRYEPSALGRCLSTPGKPAEQLGHLRAPSTGCVEVVRLVDVRHDFRFRG